MTNSEKDARNLYSVARWSEGYFDIDAKGEAIVFPKGLGGGSLSLPALCEKAKQAGFHTPVLFRFLDILKHRVQSLSGAFQKAMSHHAYDATYTPVYPIKVNQQHAVVQALVSDNALGLEAGSKPELMAAISSFSDRKGLIVCNGYKDEEYIRLALMAQALGHRVLIIIEKFSELALIQSVSKELALSPTLGVRIRLSSIAHGKWQNTGGEKSKFGLRAVEVLRLVEALKKSESLHWLSVLHVHFGSQIANIRDIQQGLSEITRYYVTLRMLGVPITEVDMGGGLAIDYEGTASRGDCSKNYDLHAYADLMVQSFKTLCEQEALPCPNLLTESGRALTAHHAVLVSDIVDTEKPMGVLQDVDGLDEDTPLSEMMRHITKTLDTDHAVELFYEAEQLFSDAQSMFNFGILSLSQRAQVEQWHAKTLHAIHALLDIQKRAHRDIADKLNNRLSSKFFLNLSIFQSAPDVWAIDQVLPIMPTTHLLEPITECAVLHDMTCDSDGQFHAYVDNQSLSSNLPLPEWDAKNPYQLAIFLVGAYQETLGDIHNLFGDTHVVNVVLKDTGEALFVSSETGDTVMDVLSLVHFDKETMLESYTRQVKEASVTNPMKESILNALQTGLDGYTYLEDA